MFHIRMCKIFPGFVQCTNVNFILFVIIWEYSSIDEFKMYCLFISFWTIKKFVSNWILLIWVFNNKQIFIFILMSLSGEMQGIIWNEITILTYHFNDVQVNKLILVLNFNSMIYRNIKVCIVEFKKFIPLSTLIRFHSKINIRNDEIYRIYFEIMKSKIESSNWREEEEEMPIINCRIEFMQW